MSDTQTQIKSCACGCGRTFQADKTQRKYADRKHQEQVNESRRKAARNANAQIVVGQTYTCSRPDCDKLYLATSSNKRFCSSVCRHRTWQSSRHLDKPQCYICSDQVSQRSMKYCQRCRKTVEQTLWKGKSLTCSIFCRTCRFCEKDYVTKYTKQFYCSVDCRLGRQEQQRIHRRQKSLRITMFYCLFCGKETKKRGDGQYSCSSCRPEAQNIRARAYSYGIDIYKVMQLRSEKLCHACGLPFDGSSQQNMSQAIDHCHESGRIRGVIHQGCNAALGQAKESPERLRALADYLERTASVDLR
jgi:hypothetical protein